MVAPHVGQRFGFQQGGAARHQRLDEAHRVAQRRNQPAAARLAQAGRAVGAGVGTAVQAAQARLAGVGHIAHIERGQPPVLLVGQEKTRVGHVQRLEDVAREEGAQGLAGHHFDDASQHVGGQRIFPLLAGVKGQWEGGQPAHQFSVGPRRIVHARLLVCVEQ